MTNREFTAQRTMLANAMAMAGAELLEYMGTAGALAAIPNTDPPQYVVAGTLQIIGKLLPGVEPTSPAVPAPSQVPAELSEERIDSIAKPFAGMGGVEDYRSFARAVERELRAGSRCAQPKLDQLHNAIMNLPAMAPYDRVRHSAEHRAYLIGHRNARHAAAELVNGLELRAGSSDVRDQALSTEVRRVGYEMSNVMFNLAQRPGDPLTSDVVSIMDKLRKDWDAAIRALKSAAPAASKEGGAT